MARVVRVAVCGSSDINHRPTFKSRLCDWRLTCPPLPPAPATRNTTLSVSAVLIWTYAHVVPRSLVWVLPVRCTAVIGLGNTRRPNDCGGRHGSVAWQR